ncbi:hypothetical protein Q5P01_022179 [Channa striata]|uniref:Cystatin fetuin-A-type domain-containing protein n=1 Tax=Channa striata TaxID=64152 RepID=A0AA88IXF2_CHASR|nr:hypothetical protein Q5P01_022179 [Channa striata]
MKTLGISVVLGLLVGVWAQAHVRQPLCDSPEAEEVALAARDYLNSQHTHGYKYDLNRIEDIKVHTGANGDDIYALEIDMLETNCHVMDPTPLPNCTVRPKQLTAVEGDCDVVLKRVGGVLNVIAFKCKTEESREDLCLGCYTLLPLNDITALKFVHDSLATFNNINPNTTYTILEVGRMSSQIVSGGHQYLAEYVIIEANCTGVTCEPLNDPMAERGICTAKGFSTDHTVDCKMFSMLMPIVDVNNTLAAVPVFPKSVHVHGDHLSHKHGFGHHKLTALHDPHLSGLLSAESAESSENVPVAPAVMDPATPVIDPAAPAIDPTASAVDPAAPVIDPTEAGINLALAVDPAVNLDSSYSREVPHINFKREVHDAPPAAVADNAASQGIVPLVPVCPGRIRFYK